MGFLAFPSSLFIEHLNVPSYRQIVPNSVNETEIHWTFFGFEDDTPELAKLRLKQANLVGAAGYVLVEDAEVLAKQQRVMEVSPDMNHILEMGRRQHRADWLDGEGKRLARDLHAVPRGHGFLT
jgi:hypothetical protein